MVRTNHSSFVYIGRPCNGEATCGSGITAGGNVDLIPCYEYGYPEAQYGLGIKPCRKCRGEPVDQQGSGGFTDCCKDNSCSTCLVLPITRHNYYNAIIILVAVTLNM